MKKPALIVLLLLCSCARAAWQPPMVATDSAAAPIFATWPTGKVKIVGNVIIQSGQGNQASQADNRKAGQHQATNASRAGGTPWWVFAGLVLIGAVGGAWLRGKFTILSFLK